MDNRFKEIIASEFFENSASNFLIHKVISRFDYNALFKEYYERESNFVEMRLKEGVGDKTQLIITPSKNNCFVLESKGEDKFIMSVYPTSVSMYIKSVENNYNLIKMTLSKNKNVEFSNCIVESPSEQ